MRAILQVVAILFLWATALCAALGVAFSMRWSRRLMRRWMREPRQQLFDAEPMRWVIRIFIRTTIGLIVCFGSWAICGLVTTALFDAIWPTG
jgi:hypothetical protein